MKTCTRIGMLVLLTGLACGCDAGWDLYEAIEVGQPLPGPAELPEGSTRKVAGLEWVKIDLGGLPWRSHYTATHAAVGPDGNVRVKAYSRRHQSHWLLFVATETRLAMELDVPEEAFRDTPATKGFIASVLQAFANAMVGQDTAEREAAEAPAPPDAVSSEAVRTARRQRLDRILALAAKARNASVEVQSDVTDVPATQPAPGADVASYAWAAYAIMTGMSCPAGESEELVTSIPVDVKSTMMIGMTLAMTRGVHLLNSRLRAADGAWSYSLATPLTRLRGQLFGVVGLGRIGTASALRAKALGMGVAFYDPYKPDGYDKALGIRRFETLEELLAGALVVSLHCPLTDETRHIIDAAAIAAMPRGSYLVNTARGAVVDTRALPEAIASGQLAGAAIDVLPQEPPPDDDSLLVAWRDPDHPAHHRLILNPHSAFYSEEGLLEIRQKTAEACRRAVLGLPLRNVVN